MIPYCLHNGIFCLLNINLGFRNPKIDVFLKGLLQKIQGIEIKSKVYELNFYYKRDNARI